MFPLVIYSCKITKENQTFLHQSSGPPAEHTLVWRVTAYAGWFMLLHAFVQVGSSVSLSNVQLAVTASVGLWRHYVHLFHWLTQEAAAVTSVFSPNGDSEPKTFHD